MLAALPIALQHANDGRLSAAFAGLDLVCAWHAAELPRLGPISILESTLDVALVAVWICAAVGADILAAEFIAIMLPLVQPGFDPWLKLQFSQDAAQALLQGYLRQDERYAHLRMDSGIPPVSESDRLDRALAQLGMAAPLLADFSGSEMRNHHARLEAALLERHRANARGLVALQLDKKIEPP